MAHPSPRIVPKLENIVTRDDLRVYHQKRRALAKKLGICVQCDDAKAMEARTKCFACLSIEAQAQRNRRAA